MVCFTVHVLCLADMFLNNHKTDLNVFFIEKFQIQKEFTTPFEEMSSQGQNKRLQKSYLSVTKRDRNVIVAPKL